MRPPRASLTTGIEREYSLRQEFCALSDICSHNAQTKFASECVARYWAPAEGSASRGSAVIRWQSSKPVLNDVRLLTRQVETRLAEEKRSERWETRPRYREARLGGIAFSRVTLSGLASPVFPRYRQCCAFPMPLDISGYETELGVPAANNSAASGIRRQMINIRQERVETVTPAWINVVVGRKHASILFPQELVLMSFWHGARVGMLGCGSNSERAV